jgi:hypothetical protein
MPARVCTAFAANVHLYSSGEPIRNLQYPYVRWRRTLVRIPQVRYRKPSCARHSSVSWNLMIGRNPLWVARQHGHSIATMLSVYAAWTEGSTEADLKAIQHAKAPTSLASERAESAEQTALRSSVTTPRLVAVPTRRIGAAASFAFATGIATRHRQGRAQCSKRQTIIGGERGIVRGCAAHPSLIARDRRRQGAPTSFAAAAAAARRTLRVRIQRSSIPMKIKRDQKVPFDFHMAGERDSCRRATN